MSGMKMNTAPLKNTRLVGIVMIILGVIALAFPLAIGATINFFFGVLLAIAGATYFLGSYRVEELKHRWGHLGLAAIFALVGLLLLIIPSIGIAAFTLLLALVFIVQGAVMLYSAVFSGGARRGLLSIAGAIGIIAGFLMIGNWPSSAAWLVGMLAGINLIVLGVALLTMKVEIRTHRTTRPSDQPVIEGEVIAPTPRPADD